MENQAEGKTLTKDALERELNKVANKAVMFVNFSEEIFSGSTYIGKDGKEHVDDHCKWDGSPFRFEPGEATYLPTFQFLRMQKHLVDREMNRAKIPTNNHLRKEYEDKCSVPVVKEDIEAVREAARQEAAKLEAQRDPEKEIAEAKSEPVKSKGGRPRKIKPMDEDSFEGLKDNEGSSS